MIYNEELQQTTFDYDDDFNQIVVQNGEHVGIYDGEAAIPFDTLYIASLRKPLEANRIFKTKAHMLAYIEDRLNDNGTINENSTESTVKTALPGLILTVIDDEDSNNNGMYYIENADPETTPGLSASKINITGPIPNEKIDELFIPEEQAQ